MADHDSSLPLLQKLCELQQQQFDKLTELSASDSRLEAQSLKMLEGYQHQSDLYQQQHERYEQDRIEHKKRLEDHAAQARQGRIGSWIMLGLIALSIIVSHYL